MVKGALLSSLELSKIKTNVTMNDHNWLFIGYLWGCLYQKTFIRYILWINIGRVEILSFSKKEPNICWLISFWKYNITFLDIWLQIVDWCIFISAKKVRYAAVMYFPKFFINLKATRKLSAALINSRLGSARD